MKIQSKLHCFTNNVIRISFYMAAQREDGEYSWTEDKYKFRVNLNDHYRTYFQVNLLNSLTNEAKKINES